jgi:hypothetical protein
MSGGGGTAVETQDPWSGIQPYLKTGYSEADRLRRGGGPQYFPGQGFADPNKFQIGQHLYNEDFMNRMFQRFEPGAGAGQPAGGGRIGAGAGGMPMVDPNTGQVIKHSQLSNPYGSPQLGGGLPTSGGGGLDTMAPSYDLMTDAQNHLLMGGPAGGMSGGINPMFMGNLGSMFGGYQNQIRDHRNLFQNQQTPWDFTPGHTGAPDPSAAINQMLSGTPDYAAVQAATRAGAQPTLDILREDVLPQLRGQTVATNNMTGEIKDQNRIIPRVMRDITNAGTQAALGEYNRAMGSRERGAQLAGGLGAQYAGMGLQGAQFGAGLGENFLDRGMNQGAFNASLGLQGDQARQGALDTYRNQVLGLGNLGAGLSGQAASNMLGGIGSMPTTTGLGLMPGELMGARGDFWNMYDNLGIQDQMNRWDYEQNLPYRNQDWYMQQLQGTAGLGGTTTQQGGGSNMLGQLLGAGLMAAPFIPWSDRRLKTHIRQIGTVLGHKWYTFRYRWGQWSQGVMADEVPAEFVRRHPSGYLMVDYNALLGN